MPNPSYTTYAAAYDPLGQGHWGTALARFALTAATDRGPAPRTALDLACGTGAVSAVLAAAGLRTVGLDRSAAMLGIARQKVRQALLVRADLRAFAFTRPFDLIVCAYDSLNYLTTPHELGAAFACARATLAPHGLFVCDLTTRHAYIGETDHLAHELDLDDLGYRWQTSWDEGAGLAATTIGTRQGRGTWQTERHLQRPYAPAEVAAALQGAGLHLRSTHGTAAAEPDSRPPAPHAPRVVYVATREN